MFDFPVVAVEGGLVSKPRGLEHGAPGLRAVLALAGGVVEVGVDLHHVPAAAGVAQLAGVRAAVEGVPRVPAVVVQVRGPLVAGPSGLHVLDRVDGLAVDLPGVRGQERRVDDCGLLKARRRGAPVPRTDLDLAAEVDRAHLDAGDAARVQGRREEEITVAGGPVSHPRRGVHALSGLRTGQGHPVGEGTPEAVERAGPGGQAGSAARGLRGRHRGRRGVPAGVELGEATGDIGGQHAPQSRAGQSGNHVPAVGGTRRRLAGRRVNGNGCRSVSRRRGDSGPGRQCRRHQGRSQVTHPQDVSLHSCRQRWFRRP